MFGTYIVRRLVPWYAYSRSLALFLRNEKPRNSEIYREPNLELPPTMGTTL